MKKFLAIVLAIVCVFAVIGCAKDETVDTPVVEDDNNVNTEVEAEPEVEGEDEVIPEVEPEVEAEPEAAVLTYDEYMAAELETEVVVEAYVQGKQSWWDNKVTVYAQDENGGYFFYELACSEEDAAKLEVGTKIRVTGFKGEWAGEDEVMDGTFEFVEADAFVAEPLDVTALLGTDELVAHQNKLVAFKGLTVVSVEYKNGEPGDDIYVKVSDGNAEYDFCVERYLTDPETEVYKTVGTLVAGDVIDVEGFLYWYEGVNTHITSVAVAAADEASVEVAE